MVRKTEEAVVCALLVEENGVVEVAPWLTAEMFYTPELGFIYAAIVAQYEEGKQPDVVATGNRMRQMDGGLYDRMGGLAFISEGLARVRHAGNLVAYAEEVKRQYTLRRLDGLFTTLKAKTLQASADCSSVIAEAESGLLHIREEQQQGDCSLQSAGRLAADTIAYHRRRTEKEEDSRCVLTGLDGLDRLMGGLHPGELYVLAGRPGDGKSAIAIQIAINAAQKGKRVCFFSLEMDPVQIMNRLFTGYAGVETSRLRRETPAERDFERMQELHDRWHDLPLHIDYTAGNSAGNIRAQAMLQKKRSGCDLIVVDYLHLLEHKPAKGETLEQAIARQVRFMKRIAYEAGCPLLLLSQMNRNVENRQEKMHMPQLSDLRDSGTIEQVADCVFFVYRPDRYGITKDTETGKPLRREGKLIVAKNRNGNTGIARFCYNDTFTQLS